MLAPPGDQLSHEININFNSKLPGSPKLPKFHRIPNILKFAN